MDDVSIEELKERIKLLPKGKTPGPSRISNEIL